MTDRRVTTISDIKTSSERTQTKFVWETLKTVTTISYVSISTITGIGPGRHSIIVDSLLLKLILSGLIVKSRYNAFF